MAVRLKLKCPTCFHETYVKVGDEQDEQEIIDQVNDSHYNGRHARPRVERREEL